MGDSSPPPARATPWNKPISLQEMRLVIRYEMGWKSLRNYLEAVELEKKRTIVRRTRRKHRTTHLVTLAAIARWAPEIVPADVLGDRAGVGSPNDATVMRALTELRARQDERMAETARNVFEARNKPYAQRLAAVEAKVFPNQAIPR